MTIIDVIRSMRERMPWPVGQRILRELELPRGRGWQNTIDRVSDASEDYSGKAEALEAALKEHLLCGEKLVRYYAATKKAAKEIADALSTKRIPASPFKDSYPLLLSEGQLDDYSTDSILVAVEQTDDGVAAVFASVRSMMFREQVSKSKLPEDARQALEQYDELLGVRYVRSQALDIVAISTKSGVVSVRTDFPVGIHRDIGEAMQSRLKAEFATGSLEPFTPRQHPAIGGGRAIQHREWGRTHRLHCSKLIFDPASELNLRYLKRKASPRQNSARVKVI